MHNTLCVPDLRSNLMSVSKITEKGYKVTFTRNIAKITDSKGEVSAIADRIDNLYYLY